MFTSLLTKQTSYQGGPSLSQMRYVRERLSSNYQRLKEYYQNSGGWVGSRHILIRLLSNLTAPMSMQTELYYNYALDNYDACGRGIGVTSAITRGNIHLNGSFYGKRSSEIYIATESAVNPLKIHADWRNQTPIKVLRHPYSDLGQQLPDGEGFTGGVAVFSIDIPILALMYRAWNLEEAEKPSGQRETPAQFIYQYVLPPMIPSQTDVAMFNRICARAMDDPINAPTSKHSISLPTPNSYVDAIIQQYLNWAVNGGLSFERLLDHMPQAFSPSISDTVVVSGLVKTRQSKWASTIPQIPVLGFLLLVDHLTESQANKGAKVDIGRDIRIIDSERLFAGVRGGVLDTVREDIRVEIEPYLK